jgi:hypothetical protein
VRYQCIELAFGLRIRTPDFRDLFECTLEELPSGELRVVPVARVREFIRKAGRQVAAKDREALQILADYDRGKMPRK